MQKVRVRRGVLSLVVIAAAAVVLALTVGGSSRAAVTAHAVTPAVGSITIHPDVSKPQSPVPGSQDTFGCQSSPIDGSAGPRCYSPQQIQQAYGFSSLISHGVTGAGKTIVIVDAYSNPWIQDDLSIEDSTFGLPAPPSFSVVAPQGVPPFDLTDPNQVGWASEISLDVLSAHAMAPGANILLVEGASGNDSDLYAAEKWAVDNHVGDVMSQSFGEADSCVDPAYLGKWHDLFRVASNRGWTVFASSGDSGASQFNCAETSPIIAASWPAVDPNVTGVGGTTLSATDDPTGTAATPSGTYLGETAWTEPLQGCSPPDDDDINCSGGGFSSVFGRPLYQLLAVQGHARGVPDVAYDAGVNGGLLIHSGVLLAYYYGLDPTAPYFFIFGGTSAGSPQWSALAADADQMAHHDLGAINDNLYSLALVPRVYHSLFNDVTTGTNDVADLGGQGYSAGLGWDPVTGLGTPKAQNLVPALAFTGGH